MQPYAFFLDIDGTVMWNGEVSLPVGDALREAHRRGHRVCINTGRSYAVIGAYVLNILPWDGIVSGIGAHVLVDGKVVYRQTISPECLMRVAEGLVKAGHPFLFEGEETNVGFFLNRHDTVTLEKLSDLAGYLDCAFSKITFAGVLSDSERKLLEPDMRLYQHKDYAEASIMGCDKGTGMLKAIEAMGIPKERCIAVGDGKNDWDMLAAAGTGIAMGNAREETKQRCDIVAPSAAQDGVAWVIRKYCEF